MKQKCKKDKYKKSLRRTLQNTPCTVKLLGPDGRAYWDTLLFKNLTKDKQGSILAEKVKAKFKQKRKFQPIIFSGGTFSGK